MRKKRLKLSTTHIIMLSFLAAILIGTVLLCLPVSSANGKATPFIGSKVYGVNHLTVVDGKIAYKK